MIDVPLPARNGAHRVLIWAFNGAYQVIETDVCDRCSIHTITDALFVEKKKYDPVDLDSRGEYVVVIILVA